MAATRGTGRGAVVDDDDPVPPPDDFIMWCCTACKEVVSRARIVLDEVVFEIAFKCIQGFKDESQWSLYLKKRQVLITTKEVYRILFSVLILNHSYLNASIGSILAARWAGIQAARAATATMSMAAPIIVRGS